MNYNYDDTSDSSIINYAKKLKEKSLREVCRDYVDEHKYKGKGNFGQTLEKYYFGYEPNSNPEPDFNKVDMELKSSPLKILKNKEYRSKERLVLNIINYIKVHEEIFEESSFWKKNAHLLLVFYLHEKEENFLDYIIKLVGDWQYPKDDLHIIKRDWEVINQKIKNGRAHEISEGDTFYLGACTKGATAKKSLRDQPFSTVKAKQRAYSFKQGYVNHIIANLAEEEPAIYGKILDKSKKFDKDFSFEEIVISKFKPFYGKSAIEIEQELGIELNPKSKSYFASLTTVILGLKLGQKIEEFEKADIQSKTVRIQHNGTPKESISFPTFKYEEIIKKNWDTSDFKTILEQKYFFVFYKYGEKGLILQKVKFWNMPLKDIEEAKKVWVQTVKNIKDGKIVKAITPKGIRKTYFPKKSENNVSHVRPHAQNKDDTYSLPFRDKYTGLTEYTKHCFWLNSSYIKFNILE